jgi:NADPH2:quinone reductase
VKLPDNISYEQAAAMMLKGLTVQYLVRQTYKVQKGDNVLIQAAAGGIGLIACQWANHLGANVIGTVGSKEKAELARKHGAHHTILYRNEDFPAKVKEITGGKMCAVVYDGVGKATFPASLDCLKPLGMFVSFGSASGQIEAFNINILQTKGSLFATRPTLNTYAAKREDLLKMASELFEVVGSQDPSESEISAQGRAESAPGSRRPRNDGINHSAAVTPIPPPFRGRYRGACCAAESIRDSTGVSSGPQISAATRASAG